MMRWLIALLVSLNTVSASSPQGMDEERPASSPSADNDTNPQEVTKNLPFPLKAPSPNLSHIIIDEISLDSGNKAWLVHNKDIPVIALSFVIKDAGTKADSPHKIGVERVFLAMIDEGAGDMDAQTFKRYLLENNISLNADNNLDMAVFSLRFPKSSMEQGFHVLKLLINSLSLNETDLEKVKSHLKVTYTQGLEDDSNIMRDAISGVLVKGTVYETSLKNALKDLGNISTADLKDFYKLYMTADKLIISACGAITKSELKKHLNECLKDVTKVSTIAPKQEITPQNLGTRTNIAIDVPQSTVVFAHPFVQRDHPDFYALDIAIDVFGGNDFNARLMKSIRVHGGLAYGASANQSISDHLSMVYGSASTRTQTVEQVVSLMKSEWDKFITQGITQEELDAAKEKSIAQFSLRLSGTGDIASILTAIQYHNLGNDFLQKRTTLINALTLEQVNTAIKKHFTKEKFTLFVGGRVSKSSTLEGSAS